MSDSSPDSLPQIPSVSALVRRIRWRLNAELAIRGHMILSDAEAAAMFDLGRASSILDGVAILPGMSQHEERARRDLLELYSLHERSFRDPLEKTQRVGAITTVTR